MLNKLHTKRFCDLIAQSFISYLMLYFADGVFRCPSVFLMHVAIGVRRVIIDGFRSVGIQTYLTKLS